MSTSANPYPVGSIKLFPNYDSPVVIDNVQNVNFTAYPQSANMVQFDAPDLDNPGKYLTYQCNMQFIFCIPKK